MGLGVDQHQRVGGHLWVVGFNEVFDSRIEVFLGLLDQHRLRQRLRMRRRKSEGFEKGLWRWRFEFEVEVVARVWR